MTHHFQSQDLRDSPSDEFIEAIRTQFPIEAEMDRVLTRKMRLRQSASLAGFKLEQLVSCLDSMLAEKLGGAFKISDTRWLAGGASKMQVFFTLDWDDPEIGRTRTDMVLRMEPAESLNATSRVREWQLLAAFRETLPVPRVFWLDAESRWFPQEAIVYEFVRGVTKPRRESGKVSGIGQTFSPDIRAAIAPQFIDHLARIHTFDYRDAELSAFDLPRIGSAESALFQLNRARRVWAEDRGFELPLFDVAADWLADNLPILDLASVLHGDYRAGNFMFDEDTLQITGWLDWERGYIGDRHRDLAWTSTSTFGNYAEDGKTFLVSGLIPSNDFFRMYEDRSGLVVDPERLHFYRVLNSLQLMVSALATAYRLVRLGKTHQDVLLAWVEGAGYAQAEELRRAMQEDLLHA